MTLDELTKPLTVDEVKAAIYGALAASGVNTTSWKPGAVVRTIIAGVAIVLSAASQLQAAIAKSGFLELAEGDWLTLVAKYVYGVERDEGSFATCEVTLDNTGGGLYSGGVGDLLLSVGGTKTFRNTAAFSISPSETGVVIPMQAVELGTGSNTVADEIDTFETPLLGVVIAGSTAAVGTDEEDDAALRLRCREKTATLSPNGPRDAYAYIARSAKRNGASIGVTRVLTVPDGIGGVDVYVATATGGVLGTVGDLGTDLGVIDDEIQKKVAPLAITARTHTATAVAIDVEYELWVRDSIGRTPAQLEEDIADRLTDYLATVPIGGEQIIGELSGRVYLSALEGVIGGEVGDELVKLILTTPVADVDLAISEAPVIGTVTVTGIYEVNGGSL